MWAGVVLLPLLVGLALLAAFGSVIAGIYLASRLNRRAGRSSSGMVALSVVLGLLAVPLLIGVIGFYGLNSGSSATVDTPASVPAQPVPSATVPDLTGMDRAAATSKLGDLGLTASVFFGAAGAVPQVVVSQDPAPGTELALGDTVTLVVTGPTGTAPPPGSTPAAPSPGPSH